MKKLLATLFMLSSISMQAEFFSYSINGKYYSGSTFGNSTHIYGPNGNTTIHDWGNNNYSVYNY